MDYGIAGRRAIVCASSRGLGKGCAIALAREGVAITINGRDPEVLALTAAQIEAQTGEKVTMVAADVTTDAGRAQLHAACPNPDILVTNAAGPGPGSFQDWGREDWLAALDQNMITPLELMRAVIPGMVERRFGRIINITSSSVKAPIGILGLSNGARAGLTGAVAGLARQVAAHNVTINNLLPGAFDTDRRAAIIAAGAKASGRASDEVMQAQVDAIPAARFGHIEEFGQACAFFASAHAGFITGQNLLLDGGEYPGTF
ncbi:MAG TPA: SDR family oxidoreductase [Eoetvoesiella sp.]